MPIIGKPNSSSEDFSLEHEEQHSTPQAEEQFLDLLHPELDLSTPEPTSQPTGYQPQSVNSIQITIADKQTPLVILAGPPACGKTMTLIRLARFLKEKGYQVEPVRTLRPASDIAYKELCDNFQGMLSTPLAAQATNLISFLLVRVLQQGKVICQILEAPGEHYFDPNNPTAPLPTYLNQIFADRIRKIWTILVEHEWKDSIDRANYVQRIRLFQQQMTTRDHTIFLLNKIDTTGFVIGRGRVNNSSARRDIENNYPNIFAPFRNTHPISSFWKPWRCEFLPFQTGTYTVDPDNGALYFQPGPDEYPSRLWAQITKYIRG